MPKPETVNKALSLIDKRYSNYEYFFDKLDSAAWIQPLQEHGLFQHPPPPKRDGEFINFPFWPESRYLSRMASVSPKQVLDIVLKMPQTDNVRVHVDFIDAACNMPPELAAQWALKEAKWIESQQYLYFHYPEKIGSLIIYLAENNQIAIALDLAQSLLEILPDQKFEHGSGLEERYKPSPEPKIRFDIWNYEQVLGAVFPALIEASCFEAFSLLSDLLETFIRLSRAPENGENYEDYSSIWRPAIEDDDQNLYDTLEDMLVSAVRDNAKRIGSIDVDHLTHLIHILKSKRWKVFSRIALHLLGIYADRVPILAANHITNKSFFNDNSLWHEYALLTKQCFKLMKPSQQEIILKWINMGPDLGSSIELKDKSDDNKSNDCEIEQFKKIWKRDRLALIIDDLSPDWRSLYESLIKDLGDPSHPEFTSYSESWIGPTSPKSSEELKSMTVDNIIQFLKSWSSTQELRAPTPEGLGRMLSITIADEPQLFALEAAKFQGLDPAYIRALVSGLDEALKKGSFFEWQPILNLCQWVICQPVKIPERVVNNRDTDIDWKWTRKAIARLLQRGFEDKEGKIPFSLRSICWSILSSLTQDPDPTPADEAVYGGSNMSPAALSINTTRGEAMHALIQYAFWIRQYVIEAHSEDYFNSLGFNKMPEVQEILEYHLNPDYDPSPAVRSVYGRWFPWLILLDQKWTYKNVAKIFPHQMDKVSRDLHSAAWETYLSFCGTYDNAFEILENEYFDAIECLGPSTDNRNKYSVKSDKRLVDHLSNLYWRGKLDLDDPLGLISRFYAKAPDSLRKHAIEYIGRSLCNTKDEINPDILKRLQALWIKRIDHLQITTKRGTYPLEPIAFGWWFISGKFDEIWNIEQFKSAIGLAGRIEPDYSVLKHLSKIANKMQLQAVECLDLLVKNENELRSITLSQSDETRNILEKAIDSKDPEATKIAIDLIHSLGARGFFGYRDLIPRD